MSTVQVPYVGAAALVLLSAVDWTPADPALCVDWSPAQPDVQLAVWQYPGTAPLAVFEGAPIVGNARLQIRARGGVGDAATAAGMCHTAFVTLAGITDVTVTSSQIAAALPGWPASTAVDCHILSIESADLPTAAERNEKERPVWTVNLLATVELIRA